MHPTDLATHTVRFDEMTLPTGRLATIPNDIPLVIPENASLSAEQRCTLASIPWNDTYLEHVPAKYQAFFLYALPYMSARTTSVHTALSVAQLTPLLRATSEPVDANIVYLAVILHDIGWSKVNHEGIVASLSYSGVELSQSSQIPKRQHGLYGEAMALDLLEAYDFGDKPLSSADALKITDAIRQHDHDAPWEAGRHGAISLETYLVCDADRSWSYTHENFWQDTIRKNVEPEIYIKKIGDAIDGYFFTDQGRHHARTLLAVRETEVSIYLQQKLQS